MWREKYWDFPAFSNVLCAKTYTCGFAYMQWYILLSVYDVTHSCTLFVTLEANMREICCDTFATIQRPSLKKKTGHHTSKNIENRVIKRSMVDKSLYAGLDVFHVALLVNMTFFKSFNCPSKLEVCKIIPTINSMTSEQVWPRSQLNIQTEWWGNVPT